LNRNVSQGGKGGGNRKEKQAQSVEIRVIRVLVSITLDFAGGKVL
jgi:hypothetical protein